MNAHSRIEPATAANGSPGFSSRNYVDMMRAGAFADMRVELVGGAFLKMMPSDWRHGEGNANLVALLKDAYATHGIRVGCDVIIEVDAGTVRAADVVAVTPEFSGQGATTGADLVLAVEISNTTLAYDLGEKLFDYARAGIPHYWVVDLNSRAVHVMGAPSASGYGERSIVRFGEELAVPGADTTIVID